MAIKWLHVLASKAGFSLGGHAACLKNGCSEYSGHLPTETMRFWDAKSKESGIKVEGSTPA